MPTMRSTWVLVTSKPPRAIDTDECTAVTTMNWNIQEHSDLQVFEDLACLQFM